MVTQKKIADAGPGNGQHRRDQNGAAMRTAHRPVNFTANLCDVAHDITQLVELQGKLLVVDAAEAKESVKLPIVLAIVGGMLGVCSMPLLLVAGAQGLMVAGLLPWAAYAVVAGIGFAIAGILLWQSARAFKQSTTVLERSRSELSQNVTWLKQMLRQRSEAARADANCRT